MNGNSVVLYVILAILFRALSKPMVRRGLRGVFRERAEKKRKIQEEVSRYSEEKREQYEEDKKIMAWIKWGVIGFMVIFYLLVR